MVSEDLSEQFGADAVLLANHYMRRYKLHQMRLGILELDHLDIVAFLLIDEEIELCKAWRLRQTEKNKGNGQVEH